MKREDFMAFIASVTDVAFSNKESLLAWYDIPTTSDLVALHIGQTTAQLSLLLVGGGTRVMQVDTDDILDFYDDHMGGANDD